MVRPYGRHTHEVEERILHQALSQPARRASEALSIQRIRFSASSCIRTLRRMGASNPDVCTSGYIGMYNQILQCAAGRNSQQGKGHQEINVQ